MSTRAKSGYGWLGAFSLGAVVGCGAVGCSASDWAVPTEGLDAALGDGGVVPVGSSGEPQASDDSNPASGVSPSASDVSPDESDGADETDDANGSDDADGTDDSGNGSTTDVNPATTDDVEPEVPLDCSGEQAPRHRLIHLTVEQFDRSIWDLLLAPVNFSERLPEDEKVVGFAAPAQVDTTLARGWWESAAEVGTMVASDAAAQTSRLAECELASGRECVSKAIDAFGLRTFRRPLTADERTEYGALYDETLADGNSDAVSLGAVVRTMLLSPNFLFRVETPPEPGEVRTLDRYEFATRLSFLLWGRSPDKQLLDAAGGGQLDTQEGLTEHVDRMLQHQNARWVARDFLRQWMELGELDVASFAPEVLVGPSAIFAANDEDSVFSVGGDATDLPPEVDVSGLLTWDIPAARVQGPFSELAIELNVETSDGDATLRVMLNDEVVLDQVALGEGRHTVQAPVNVAAGAGVKVSVETLNATDARTVEFLELHLNRPAPEGDLAAAMREQAERFFEDIVFEGGDLSMLLSGSNYPINQTLAPFFGVDAPTEDWETTSLEGQNRVGLLTLPAVLAAHGGMYSGGTSPIKRGVWLLNRVLCLPHPPPLSQLPDYCSDPCDEGTCAEGSSCIDDLCVADGAPECEESTECGALKECYGGKCIASPAFCIPNRTLDQTTREWWDSFGSACHSCHETINGVGYALEHYDGIGRYRTTERTTEGAEDINAAGLVDLDERVEFYGAPGLVQALTEGGIGAECYTSSWFTYAYGQVADGHVGSMCTERAMAESFEQGDQNLLGLLRSIALSPEFQRSAGAETTQE